MDNTLTEKQQAFLDALFDEDCKGNFRKAAKKAGYSVTINIESWLTKRLREEIVKAAENYLAFHSVEAIEATAEVMRNPIEPGSDKRLAAAIQILDRAGLTKKESLKLDGERAIGLLILPSKTDIKIPTDSPQEA